MSTPASSGASSPVPGEGLGAPSGPGYSRVEPSGLKATPEYPSRGLNRRGFLCTAVAVAVVPAIPTLPSPAVAVPFHGEPKMLAWLVGSQYGEMDWRFIAAATEEEAKAAWATGWSSGQCECSEIPESWRPCEFCSHVENASTDRVPQFDGRREEEITGADWLGLGYGTFCDRCGHETFIEEDAHAIGDKAVCYDCMTIADWDIADPERAAEMRADLEDEPPASGTETAKADKTEGLGPKGDGPAPTTVGGRP